MTMRIVTICPGGVVTGGPEAQHQLIDMVNRISPGSGYVCYTPFEENHTTPEPYAIYDAPIIRREDIPVDALVVIPEIWPHLIEELAQPCAFWWLSVDSFWSWSGNTAAMRKADVHLTQSEYARRHLTEVHGLESLMLTDYINIRFRTPTEAVKRPRVAVNPAKGKDLIDQFRLKFPDIDVVELTGMTRDEVQRELADSVIYIDFGHHPGRDRLPREAALSHVVVLTTKRGSAANEIDVPVEDWYKFDTVDEAGEKARAILAHPETHVAAQKPYRDAINAQYDDFRHQVERLVRFARTLASERVENRYLAQYFDRPWYAHCIFFAAVHARKLGYEKISVAQFGVSDGRGLALLDRYASEVSDLLGIGIEVYGFDGGRGLPAAKDYRDEPHIWREGSLRLNEDAVRERLANAEVVVGNIEDTLPSFFQDREPAPVGAVFFELKMYSATKVALGIFDTDEKFRAPRIFCFFADLFGDVNSLHSDYAGERLAINEFNTENELKKISPAYYLHYWALNLRDNIFIEHDFAHSKYGSNIANEDFFGGA